MFDATPPVFSVSFYISKYFLLAKCQIYVSRSQLSHIFPMGLGSWKLILPGAQAKHMTSFSGLPTCSSTPLPVNQKILWVSLELLTKLIALVTSKSPPVPLPGLLYWAPNWFPCSALAPSQLLLNLNISCLCSEQSSGFPSGSE